jgi:hypothetical protein
MSPVFPPAASAVRHISNTQREPQSPKYCAALLSDAAPLRVL